MQNIVSKSERTRIAIPDGFVFATAALALVVVAATLSVCSPSWFSIWIVIIFGTPHNFSEFRYFLSRLPSRFGPLKLFFITSFAGLLLLFLTESALSICFSRQLLPPLLGRLLLSIWNESLIVWILALSLLRYRDLTRNSAMFNIGLAAFASVANFLSPAMFIVSLTYLHPLIGLWILERELRRTRKSWLKAYHLCLWSVPVGVMALVLALHGTTNDAATNKLLTLSSPGAGFFTGASPTMLLAVYTFLQMVHYGVWVFAIPIATQSWKRWRVDQLAFLKKRTKLRPLIRTVIGVGVATVICAWFGFNLDYNTTIEIYVVASLAHVLAEAPFLFWMYES